MTNPEAGQGPRGVPGAFRARRRAAVIAAVVVVLFALAGGLLLRTEGEPGASTGRESDCCWQEGITPEWLGTAIGIRIPDTATDRRAGYLVGPRWDNGILAFTLTDAEARAFLGRLVPGGERMVENTRPLKKYERPDSFARLGLADPETIRAGVLKSGFCPDGLDTVEGRHLRTCAGVISHAYTPGSTRIHVRAKFEPGLSPLPTAASHG
ncbi:hypothetical protein ACWDR0_21545 [Streptomyces sp. NPDC003691]